MDLHQMKHRSLSDILSDRLKGIIKEDSNRSFLSFLSGPSSSSYLRGHWRDFKTVAWNILQHYEEDRHITHKGIFDDDSTHFPVRVASMLLFIIHLRQWQSLDMILLMCVNVVFICNHWFHSIFFNPIFNTFFSLLTCSFHSPRTHVQ